MSALSSMPSINSVLSAYTAFAGSAMLARSVVREFQSMANQLIPRRIQEAIFSRLFFIFGKSSSDMTLTIDEHLNGGSLNEVYAAAHLYLQDKISPRNEKLKVAKAQGDTALTVTITTGEEIIDFYDGIRLKWVLVSTAESSSQPESHYNKGYDSYKKEQKLYKLSFLKEHREVILGSYLPYILEFAKSKKEANRVVKLRCLGGSGGPGGGGSGSSWIKLNHPSTFDTLAMDPTVKKAIKDDLDRFIRRRGFYKRVGKAWKRGYLLYGPPGTGKSSLIAAMANYLKFNIYDLELTSIWDNRTLRSMLVSTENRSIVVIEDIDCSLELKNRYTGRSGDENTKVTLSGLLNFIDGLWSSCGDERIIVFTTNYKEKLDPALLRPGRMDMHIHMSYLTPSRFRVLASNYLGLSSHRLFPKIESLIEELEVTPATVAEGLMQNDDDPDATLQLLLEFLQNKKFQQGEKEAEPDKKLQQGDKEAEPGVKKSSRKRKSVVRLYSGANF